MLTIVATHVEIREFVLYGGRPNLSVITDGPQTLKRLAVGWIERCWHQTPDQRPAFAGMLH